MSLEFGKWPTKNTPESCPEAFLESRAHGVIYEWVHAAVREPEKMRHQHSEHVILFVKEV